MTSGPKVLPLLRGVIAEADQVSLRLVLCEEFLREAEAKAEEEDRNECKRPKDPIGNRPRRRA